MFHPTYILLIKFSMTPQACTGLHVLFQSDDGHSPHLLVHCSHGVLQSCSLSRAHLSQGALYKQVLAL